MKPVVIELQHDALNRDIPITDLCRKAYVVARKLRITEFEEWLKGELEGYSDNADIPEYREVTGEVRAWNPYHGWQPIYFEEANIAEAVSKRNNGQRIAEIENLLNSVAEKGSSLQIPFAPEQQNIICNAIGYQTQVTLMTTESGLVRVIDAVRNIILNWAIKLEEDGILGEGMTFSDDEKSKVVKHSYNVNNFYGEVTGSQIQQSSTGSSQNQNTNNFSIESISEFISELKDHLSSIDLDEESKQELNAEISTVEIQAASPRPKEGIVKESLGSIRRILEGASGGAIGQLLIQLGSLF
ncbi:MAG: hypothetical protein RPU64_02050 [Candidatus Sedimenticola sp. (ex Thyasira tokunagai)]